MRLKYSRNMDHQEFFAGKRVTIMGLGVLGRGVGDAAFIAQHGAHVIVTDKKTEGELAESVQQLKEFNNITLHLGGHDAVDFTETDMVIKAAGVRLDAPEIAAAHEASVPVYMSTALFAKFAHNNGARIAGVTGTRGKSTVSHLIYHSLLEAQVPAHLGGNIRGKSTLAMLPDIKKGDVVVLELDSWQLQGFGDLALSPQVAVLTNLMPDHLNYYESLLQYFEDKANIYRNQHEGDVFIAGAAVADEWVPHVAAPVAPIIPRELPASVTLAMPGAHNRENAAFALEALRALGIDEEKAQKSIASFAGVEGRLQFLAERNGVKIYNDNNATTPAATIAALRALEAGSVILIMGGADKGIDMRSLVLEMENRCKKVVLLAGTGTNALLSYLRASNHEIPIVGPESSMKAAVAEAFRAAQKGDVVVFSPAFASFGMFKNEYDRNDQFVSAIHAL